MSIITTDKSGVQLLLEKMSHLRNKHADKYHVFSINAEQNTKFKSNKKQILNIARLECYVCYDFRRIKKDDTFYYVHSCFSDEAYISAKFSIVCLKKNTNIILTTSFFQSILAYARKHNWNHIVIEELSYISKVCTPSDFSQIEKNIYNRQDGLHQITIDCSKLFAQTFAEISEKNYTL